MQVDHFGLRGTFHEVAPSMLEVDMIVASEEGIHSAHYVRQLLMRRYPDHFMVFADLFAMGCLLHLQGERCVGFRLVAQVLNSANDTPDEPHLAAMLKNLSGNEARFAQEICPNAEISQLWVRAERMHQREAACSR
jgi:hypothetical protein